MSVLWTTFNLYLEPVPLSRLKHIGASLVMYLLCISLSGLTRTARRVLQPAGSAEAQFISMDHTTVRAVRTRKVKQTHSLDRCLIDNMHCLKKASGSFLRITIDI